MNNTPFENLTNDTFFQKKRDPNKIIFPLLRMHHPSRKRKEHSKKAAAARWQEKIQKSKNDEIDSLPETVPKDISIITDPQDIKAIQLAFATLVIGSTYKSTHEFLLLKIYNLNVLFKLLIILQGSSIASCKKRKIRDQLILYQQDINEHLFFLHALCKKK